MAPSMRSMYCLSWNPKKMMLIQMLHQVMECLTKRISMHFLISDTRGLKRDWSCMMTSSIRLTCFITLRVFMIRTIAACKGSSQCMLLSNWNDIHLPASRIYDHLQLSCASHQLQPFVQSSLPYSSWYGSFCYKHVVSWSSTCYASSTYLLKSKLRSYRLLLSPTFSPSVKRSTFALTKIPSAGFNASGVSAVLRWISS